MNKRENLSQSEMRSLLLRVRIQLPRWSHSKERTSTLMRDGLGRASAIAPNDQVKSWAVKRGLLPDQAEAAEITVCATDWVTAIEGRAGTAKTTTVGAIKEFAAERGYLVRGFAPTTRAVKALSEAGLPARTVANLLGKSGSNRLARSSGS